MAVSGQTESGKEDDNDNIVVRRRAQSALGDIDPDKEGVVDVTVVLDVAHNPPAIDRLLEKVRQLPLEGPYVVYDLLDSSMKFPLFPGKTTENGIMNVADCSVFNRLQSLENVLVVLEVLEGGTSQLPTGPTFRVLSRGRNKTLCRCCVSSVFSSFNLRPVDLASVEQLLTVP